MRGLLWGIRIFIFLFLFAFALKNTDPVSIRFDVIAWDGFRTAS